jgi:hypothetical protein
MRGRRNAEVRGIRLVSFEFDEFKTPSDIDGNRTQLRFGHMAGRASMPMTAEEKSIDVPKHGEPEHSE